ncbi:glutathione S-transferase family protein [Aestuariivita sp.]|uniref:glutathione S-transferase family protein n=1 Tax=Aestuariivita sp. TaxID=1872407 RepID=UPI002173E949|nr:glutathione S-transferase family protein [Aestuariivita sp.]MCE8007353.1 glutathione S-transferase family protein [Aestuariivita sp.]
MTLHYAPGTIAAAVAIALNEAQVDYDRHRIDFAKKEHRTAAYLAINPKGRVPALRTRQGVLTETAAILDYIAAIRPETGLVPDDPFEAAQMRGAMTYLASTMHVNHAHGGRGMRWADEARSWADMKQKVPQTMAESAQYLEDHVMQGPYIMGDRFTLADPYLFVVLTWLPGDGVDIGNFPKLSAFETAMWDRPSVRMTLSDGIL